MKRVAIGAAVLLLAFAGYWFFLRKDKTDDNKEVAESGQTTGETPDRSKRKRGGDERERGARGDVNVLFDDDPEGALQLEGRVVNSSEDGVGGAIVSINSNPPRSVKSEGDGSFAFAKLVGRDYQIIARHSDGVAGPLVAKLTGENDPVIMKLRDAGEVEVTVLEARSGSPIAGAAVELRSIDRQSATTNSKGEARFAMVVADRYEVVAEASGFAPRHERLRVAQAGSKVSVRLELKTGAAVSGIVVDAKGTPVAGARVVYAGASEWSQRASTRWDAAETGPDGAFQFAALTAGTFRFTARAKGRAPGQSELITLDGRTPLKDVRVSLGEGAALSGRVVTSGGVPVPVARVRLTGKDAGFRGDVREVYADDRGSYKIEGLPRESLRVVAISEEASSETLPVDFTAAPFKKSLDIPLALAGAISGTVVDSSGEGIEGAQVWAFPDFRSGNRRMNFRLRGLPRVLTDAGGRFRITGLEDGKFMVRATRSESTTRAGWLVEPVSAKSGDTDVRIELAEQGSIIGKIAYANGDPPAGFSIGLGGWGGGTPFASKDGSFTLAELSPQKYTLSIRGPGFNSRQLVDVEVLAGEEKDLGTITVREGRVLEGVVVDAKGAPVADALVRAGRTIFGSGSSSNAGVRGGPPGAQNTKETRTDDGGRFSIRGLPPTDVSIVAEHETAGRSLALLIQNAGKSQKGMRVELAPYGSLEGTIRKDGQPAANIRLSVSSLTSPDVLFGVASGEDGTFRFDRLAPDAYKISAMVGTNPMMGFGFQSQRADVESGKTARVTIELAPGSAAVLVTIAETEGKQLNFSWVTAVRGEVSARNARELQLAIGRQPEGYTSQSFSIAGAPAKVPNLTAGPYAVCVAPYPAEVSGMAGTMAYLEREGDNLAVFCDSVEIADGGGDQTMTISVAAPALVPPPDET